MTGEQLYQELIYKDYLKGFARKLLTEKYIPTKYDNLTLEQKYEMEVLELENKWWEAHYIRLQNQNNDL